MEAIFMNNRRKNRLGTTTVISLILFFIATQIQPATAVTGKWSRYPVGNSGFSGEFPTEPQLETKTVPGVPGKLYLCASRDEEMNMYGAMFMEDVGVNLDRFSEAQLDDFYKTTAAGFKKGLLQALSNVESTLEVTETGQKRVAFAGLPGREIDYTVGPAASVVRMTISGRFMLMAFATAALKIRDENLEKYFSLFKFSKVPEKAR